MNKSFHLFVALMTLIVVCSCQSNYTPKPRGLFRIDTPEKGYILLDSVFPFSFEYPVYCKIAKDERYESEPYWINIDYPMFRGKIHLSYKEVSDNLLQLTEDARSLVYKHIPMATSINEEMIRIQERDVFGIVYSIKGSGAASPSQFYATDSIRHFLRGALYFYTEPDNDSLAPVIDFINKDIKHLLHTLRWKNPEN